MSMTGIQTVSAEPKRIAGTPDRADPGKSALTADSTLAERNDSNPYAAYWQVRSGFFTRESEAAASQRKPGHN
jgi:hypothetical protein